MGEYGVSVFNRFALGDSEEEEDPFESLKKLEQKKKEEKEKNTQKAKEQKDAKNKATKKEVDESAKKGLQSQNKKDEEIAPKKEGSAKPVKAGERKVSKEETATAKESAPAPRGGFGGRGRGARTNQENLPPRGVEGSQDQPSRRGGFREFSSRGDGAAAPGEGGEGGAVEGGEGTRGRGRGGFRGGRGRGGEGGRGGVRGGRGGLNSDRPSDRQFDRQSADPKSSVKGTDKRDGSGRGNWGSNKDVIDDQLAVASASVEELEASVESPAKSDGEPSVPAPQAPTDEATESPEAVEEKEPEAEEMTLDEWKALQEQEKPKPEFKIRRAGEGVDNKQWGDMVALKSRKESSDEEEESDDEDESEDEAERKAKKKSGKQILDIKFEFSDAPQRGGRGRGPPGARGRGRGDGFRGRGGVRGQVRGMGAPRGGRGRDDDRDPDLGNEREFPSLGGGPKPAVEA